jgi:NAD-dependent deacetylase
MDSQILRLQDYIDKSKYTVVITGAGISTSAGIKDMQHMNVLEVMQMMSEVILQVAPNHYYKIAWKNFLKYMFENGPTITHRKLSELENGGKIQGIITTNIDCLHFLAGSKNVAEIQGSFGVNQCIKCGEQYNNVHIWNQRKIPRCKKCSGAISAFPVRSHVGLLSEDVRKAREWISKAELVIIIGAQGCYSGVYFDYISKYAKIVHINPNPTQFDKIAEINIHKKADEVFSLFKM